mmetsp:Transcript_9981/g.24043  ORF Transcript_9981/g.24043 Transcript_9981/m.24043 type:complete len:464 (+) Transcript_9981:1202-2593(+)
MMHIIIFGLDTNDQNKSDYFSYVQYSFLLIHYFVSFEVSSHNLVREKHQCRVGNDLHQVDPHPGVERLEPLFLGDCSETLPHAGLVFEDARSRVFPHAGPRHLVRVRCDGGDPLGAGRGPEIGRLGQFVAGSESHLAALLVLSNDQFLLDLFVNQKLRGSLETAPITRRDSLVESADSLLLENRSDRIPVPGVLFLAGRLVDQDLHSRPDHPDRVGQRVANDSRREPGNQRVRGRTLRERRVEEGFHFLVGVKVGRPGGDDSDQRRGKPAPESRNAVRVQNSLGDLRGVGFGSAGRLELCFDNLQWIGHASRHRSRYTSRQQFERFHSSRRHGPHDIYRGRRTASHIGLDCSCDRKNLGPVVVVVVVAVFAAGEGCSSVFSTATGMAMVVVVVVVAPCQERGVLLSPTTSGLLRSATVVIQCGKAVSDPIGKESSLGTDSEKHKSAADQKEKLHDCFWFCVCI